MLVQKKRLFPGVEVSDFLSLILSARGIKVLAINTEIASISCELTMHGDPADRLIAATAIHHGAKLVTSDKKLMNIPQLGIVW